MEHSRLSIIWSFRLLENLELQIMGKSGASDLFQTFSDLFQTFPDLFQTIESLENGTFQICFRLLFSIFVSDYWKSGKWNISDLFQTIILQICFRLLKVWKMEHFRFVSDYYSPDLFRSDYWKSGKWNISDLFQTIILQIYFRLLKVWKMEHSRFVSDYYYFRLLKVWKMEHSRFVSDYYVSRFVSDYWKSGKWNIPDLFQTIILQICFRLLFSRFVSDYYSPDLFQTIILQICFRLLFSRKKIRVRA